MSEPAGNLELLEPVTPETLIPASWIEPWMIIVSSVILVGVIVYFLTRKSRKRPVDREKTRAAAYAKAVSGLAAISGENLRNSAIQASHILRTYLASVTEDPALYETHEETISRHDALKDYPDEVRSAVAQGFGMLAGLKYSDRVEDRDPALVIGESQGLLDRLHQGGPA